MRTQTGLMEDQKGLLEAIAENSNQGQD